MVYALEVQEPFSKYILEGRKTIETREYSFPMELLGCPILLLETAAERPCRSSLGNIISLCYSGMTLENSSAVIRVIGAAIFLRSFEYKSEKMWQHNEVEHLVPSDSPYGWSDTKRKFGWVVSKTLNFNETMNHLVHKFHQVNECNDNDLIGSVKCERVYRSFFRVQSERNS